MRENLTTLLLLLLFGNAFSIPAWAKFPGDLSISGTEVEITLNMSSPADTEAPSIPTGLVASNITETSLDLTWTASTDNVAVHGYEVFKDGEWEGANTVPSISITGLQPGTTYSFTVNAFDTAEPANVSAQSEALSVTTPGTGVEDTEAPSIPTGLVASEISDTSFVLTWNASSDNVGVHGYEIYKNKAWAGATTDTSITITGLVKGTTYSMTVSAFDDVNNLSDPSEAISVTTTGEPAEPDTEAPTVPTGLVASEITDSSFVLSWDASSDNVEVFGYEVFQDGAWVGANTIPTISITGLSSGTTYSFTVNAFDTSNPANISAPSSPLSVTTTGERVDSEAPSVPDNLVASDVNTTSFTLSWSASTDDVGVAGYEVYIDAVYYGATTSLSLEITGLNCGESYAFTVNAFDTATPANISKASSALLVSTLDCNTGIALASLQDISILPNPVSSVLFLSNLPQDASISLVTTDGKIVREVKNEGNEAIQMDISGLRESVYFIYIKAGNQTVINKVVVN